MEQAAVWETGDPVEQQEEGRRCAVCGKRLSRYNKNEVCNSHLFEMRKKPNHGISKRIAFEDPLLRPRRSKKVYEKTYPPSKGEVLLFIKTTMDAIAAYYSTTPASLLDKQNKRYSTERRDIALLMVVSKAPHASRPHIADFFNITEGTLKVLLAKARRHFRTDPNVRKDVEAIARKIKTSVV